MIIREGDFNGMSKGQQYQCNVCGTLRWSKEFFNIEDDLFIKMKCKHCGKETNHLWVGENPEDKYFYGDITLDERYYNYNTK